MKLNAGNVKSHSDITGSNEPAVGVYHVMVQSVKADFISPTKGTPGVIVEFQVMKGTVNGQEGCIHREVFWDTDAKFCQDRLLRLALVLKLLSPGEVGDVDFNAAVGRHLFIKVDNDRKDPTRRVLPGMDFWAFGDKEVVGIPFDAEALKAIPPAPKPAAQQPVGAGVPVSAGASATMGQMDGAKAGSGWDDL